MTLRALLPLALAAGCATQSERLDAPKVVSGLELAPYALHEECFALAAGDRVGYRFDAREPVAFNVHFHEGNTVILPVDVKATVEESGDFTADRGQFYCLTWEAGAQGSALEYRVQRLRHLP
jgi:hypothetical protein